MNIVLLARVMIPLLRLLNAFVEWRPGRPWYKTGSIFLVIVVAILIVSAVEAIHTIDQLFPIPLPQRGVDPREWVRINRLPPGSYWDNLARLTWGNFLSWLFLVSYAVITIACAIYSASETRKAIRKLLNDWRETLRKIKPRGEEGTGAPRGNKDKVNPDE